MRSRIGFSLKVAMLSATTGIFLGSGLLFGQADYGNSRSSEMRNRQEKPSFFRRIFTRRSNNRAKPLPQPQSQSPNGQYQQSPYAGGGGQQKSTVRQLLETRYRAEGREIPPLTLSELSGGEPQQQQQQQQPQQQQYQEQQQEQQPQYQQESPNQQSYQQPQQPYQRPQQQPQQSYQQPQQQGYAGAPSRQSRPSYGQSPQTYGGQRPNSTPYQQARQQNAPPKTQPKRRGFRGFLSRMNPFHKNRKDEFPQSASQPPKAQPPQQFRQQYAGQATPYRRPQPYGNRQPNIAPNRYAQPNRSAQPPVYARPPVHPQQPAYVDSYRRPIDQENQQVDPEETYKPQPFPSTPDTVAADSSKEDIFEEPTDQPADESLPDLSEPTLAAPGEAETTPFDDDPLPSLTAQKTPANDGFKPTEEPEFKEPIVKSESPTVAKKDSDSPFSGKTLGEEDLPDLQVELPDLQPELPNLQAESAKSPNSQTELPDLQTELPDLQAEGSDLQEKLPNLQPVPTRNNYINLDKLNDVTASVDREALRRERRRLLLLSRPEKKGLKGFCPVTLKNDRELIDAKLEFESKFQSKTYRFSSAEAKAEFDRKPNEYAPAKGGIDVVKYTIGAGEFDGSLEFAAWYRGRLYLFTSALTYDAFMNSPSKFAPKNE